LIVKLLRALASNEPGDPPVLIYDRARTHQWMIALSPERAQALLGDDLEGYFEARIERGNLRLGRRVADQDW
jgi:hypothetical protein